MLTEAWKFLPHTFAYQLSGGAWKPFHYLVFASHLIAAAVAKGSGRITVSVPPRHGKSTFISQWVPAWFLTNWPAETVLLATYEANFAATWGRKTRAIMERAGFPLDERSAASNRWGTEEGGGMITAGVGGPITGQGGKLLIVDDPHKNWREVMSVTTRKMVIDWFNSTFYTRCEPDATIIILHTRWHEEDLIGYVLTEHEDAWKHIRFPALAEEEDVLDRKLGQALCPERYDETALDKIRRAVGEQIWAGLYQQRPSMQEGNIFKREWWKRYQVSPAFTLKLQSWDTAMSKSDIAAYSACLTFGLCSNGIYLIDRWRQRVEYPELLMQAKGQYLKHKPAAVLIENRASGISLIQDLQRNTGIPVIPVPAVEDKVVRAMAASPMVESGRVYLPDFADWTNEFAENCANFPNTKFADDVDAFSQGISHLQRYMAGGAITRLMPRSARQLLKGFR